MRGGGEWRGGAGGFRRLFRLPESEGRAARDVAEEIAFHVQSRTESLVAEGLDPKEARARAAREFGDELAAREELTALAHRRVRQARRAYVHEWLWGDLRQAVRGLARTPLFAAGVVLTLALGFGANAAMFGMTDRLLLQDPPHVQAPEQLHRVYFRTHTTWAGVVATRAFAYPDWAEMRERVEGFSQLAGFQTTRVSTGRGAEAENADVLVATANLFGTLGVEPMLGRFYTEEEDRPGVGVRVVVLGHGYWQRRFGGSSAALGSTLEVGREQYTVIGVAPRGFRGIDLERVDLVLPATAYAARFTEGWDTQRHTTWLRLVGRRAPGVSETALAAELDHVRRQQIEEWGRHPEEGTLLAPVSPARAPALVPGTLQQNARITLMLLAVALIVLLIACANVANLMLARALARSRELSVRVALGVSRARLLWLVTAEALVLSAGGAALGLLLAQLLGDGLRRLLLPRMDWGGGVVDGRVALFAGALVIGCTLLVGMLPALQALRGDIAGALRSGAREGGGRRARLRAALVVTQAALCVLLLVGAGLFTRSLHSARAVDFGMDVERLLVMTWDQSALERSSEQWEVLYGEALERLRAQPGVEAAAISTTVPFWSSMQIGGMTLPSGDTIGPLPGGGPFFNAVDPEYFRTLGTRLLAGRVFTAADVAGGLPVAIVDETMARQVWPGRAAVGECFLVDGACVEVVGVTASAMRQQLGEDPAAQYFRPRAQVQEAMTALFVRTAQPGRMIEPIRRTVQAIDPALPYATIQPLSELVDPLIRPWRLGATLFLAFGALALVVASVGLYSVMAYGVTQRRHELGIRLALGARGRQLLQLVVGEAARVLALGVALGAAAALAAGPYLRDLLFRVSPRDPVVFAGVSILLFAVGLAATLLPARRAARLDAMTVLRED